MTFARGVSEATANAFGIADFDELRPRFEEYLRLVLRLLTEESVSWDGEYRAPLSKIRLEPRPIQSPYPNLWIGGGLSTTSAELAARLGLPLFLPSLFRWPEDYLPIVEHYREAFQPNDYDTRPRLGFPSYVHVARTSQEAKQRWQPYLEHYRDFALETRGSFGRATDYETLLNGPAICGSPAEVIDRVHTIDELLGLDRHLFLFDAGGVPPELLSDQMALMSTEVLPHL